MINAWAIGGVRYSAGFGFWIGVIRNSGAVDGEDEVDDVWGIPQEGESSEVVHEEETRGEGIDQCA